MKMDFLGLRTLTVIQNAVQEMKHIHGVKLDMEHIPDNDTAVYQLDEQRGTQRRIPAGKPQH
ncbi:MAG: hypothetical protein V8Q36_10855, partial [Anaerotignum sp.]